MLELVGSFGGPNMTCLITLFSILITLELTSPPSPSISQKVLILFTHTHTVVYIAGSSQIIAQYYQLIRLGQEGYRSVMENCRDNAMVLKEGIVKTGCFNILSKDNGVPVVAFSLKDRSRRGHRDEFKISAMLRRHGWVVPAYPMPPGAEHINVLRVVVRAEFSRTLAERLVLDITNAMHELEKINKDDDDGVKKRIPMDAQREIITQEANKRQKVLAA
ncbi:glutamate decarboxylase 1-like [Senna tora]|uniref:glutamate decarboxylase n=1 Tax=Senna tora TaxID=362788 RepID=A0A834WLB8_9FABA|nr:glutamate decarboxylase 1-like [Senna tora]